MIRNFFSIPFIFICLTSAFVCDAATLLVVDQNDTPLAEAVVSIPVANQVNTKNLPIAVMDQVNKQFSPQVLIIQKGQMVSFPNSDDIRHHVYSFSAVKPFELRLYKGSSGAPILFDNSGIGVLGCNIHDRMVGYIYVAENEQAELTDSSGKVSFVESLPKTVSVWHPQLSSTSSQRLSVATETVQGQHKITLPFVYQSAMPEQTTKSRKFGQRN